MGKDPLDRHLELALTTMELAVHELAALVPRPRFVELRGSPCFRYEEKSIQQAIVQKLARMVSTLRAARLLLDHGFVQEVGALQRILDEIQADVLFLRSGVDKPTDLHSRYLCAFYEEEFDAEDAVRSTQKRESIPRRKIHAHNARFFASVPGSELDPSRGSEIQRTLLKTYSGYVHAASPHIMDMYGGLPPRFHMTGMQGAPLYETHQRDLMNYFRRGLFALAICSIAFAGTAFWSDEFRRYAAKFDDMFKAGD